MTEFLHEHRVRYREVDPMGIVYHTHYLDYFEIARTEALRDVGLPYKSLEDGGVIMPVVDLAISYRRPAKYDDLLVIRTHVTMSESATCLTFNYEVVRKGEEELLVAGHVTLCFFDREARRPIRAPEHIVSLINEFVSGDSA
ncbi:MAG: thioesterase family protein [Rhodothermia bacterium]|nr:MAG: thioesterase family protein [Rhodothermia bacterium]